MHFKRWIMWPHNISLFLLEFPENLPFYYPESRFSLGVISNNKNAIWRWQWAHSVTAIVLCLLISIFVTCFVTSALWFAPIYFPVNYFGEITSWVEILFLECNQYFSRVHLLAFYMVVTYHTCTYDTFRDIIYFPLYYFGEITCWVEILFLECIQYFSSVRLPGLYIVVKFHAST